MKNLITSKTAEGLRFGFVRAGLTLMQAQVICVDLANTIGDDPYRVKRIVLGSCAEDERGDLPFAGMYLPKVLDCDIAHRHIPECWVDPNATRRTAGA